MQEKIREIIRAAEERSKYTCEICGSEEGELRNDGEHGIYRIQTLCDDCHVKRIKHIQEQRERRRKMSPCNLMHIYLAQNADNRYNVQRKDAQYEVKKRNIFGTDTSLL